jgi:O-antigen ligase
VNRRNGEVENRRQGDKENARGAEAALAPQSLLFSSSPLLLFCLLALALIIGLAPLPGLLITIGTPLALLLPLLNPVFGAALAVLSVPVQELVTLPGGLSATQAAVLLMLAGWVLHQTRQSGTDDRSRTPLPSVHPPDRSRTLLTPRLTSLAPWVFLLWALLLSSSLTPFSRNEALKETARWAVAFLAWLVAVTAGTRRSHRGVVLACLLAAPAATAALGLWQFASGDGPPSFRISPDLPFVRAYGTIGQPNSFAGYMNMAWPLALAVAIAQCKMQNVKWRLGNPRAAILHFTCCTLLVVVALLLLSALVASFSRGAWLGALAGVLGLAAALGRRWALGVGVLLATGVVALALGGVGLLPEPVAQRVASISRSVGFFDAETVAVTPENFAVVERMAQVQAGWRMLRDRPLLGVGPGNYNVVYPRVAVGQWYASRGHAHNFYLHIAAEAGLVGLAAYLALIGSVAWRAINAARKATAPFERAIAIGCCGMIAAVAGHNLFENLHVLNLGIQLAVAWALIEHGRVEEG